MSLERFLQTDCYGWQGPMVQYLVASSSKRNKVNLLFECLVTWSKTWELDNKTFSFNKFGDLQRQPLYKAPKSSNRGTQQMFPLQSSAAREPLTPLLQISLHWLLLELLVPNHYQSPDRCTLWKCCQKNTATRINQDRNTLEWKHAQKLLQHTTLHGAKHSSAFLIRIILFCLFCRSIFIFNCSSLTHWIPFIVVIVLFV